MSIGCLLDISRPSEENIILSIPLWDMELTVDISREETGWCGRDVVLLKFGRLDRGMLQLLDITWFHPESEEHELLFQQLQLFPTSGQGGSSIRPGLLDTLVLNQPDVPP